MWFSSLIIYFCYKILKIVCWFHRSLNKKSYLNILGKKDSVHPKDLSSFLFQYEISRKAEGSELFAEDGHESYFESIKNNVSNDDQVNDDLQGQRVRSQDQWLKVSWSTLGSKYPGMDSENPGTKENRKSLVGGVPALGLWICNKQ